MQFEIRRDARLVNTRVRTCQYTIIGYDKKTDNGRTMRYLIASANGYGNAGDDICAIATKNIVTEVDNAAEVKITSPPFDEELAKWAEAIVLGGGGIIYDANKDNTDNYLQYVEYAQKNNKLSIGLGLGEQGIVTPTGAERYKKTINKMDLLTIRSSKDAVRLHEIGVKRSKALVAQDLGFNFDFEKYRRRHELVRRLYKLIPRRKPKLGIVLSNQEHLVNDLKLAFSKSEKENALAFKNSLSEHIDEISKKFDVTIITQSRDDLEVAQEYADEHGCRIYSYKEKSHLSKLLKVYANQDIILTQRFHGIIFSFMLDIPVIALGYHGQKQYKLLRDMGLEKKLVMYHKPEELKSLLHALSQSATAHEEYAISLSQSHKSFIEITKRINAERLKDIIKA